MSTVRTASRIKTGEGVSKGGYPTVDASKASQRIKKWLQRRKGGDLQHCALIVLIAAGWNPLMRWSWQLAVDWTSYFRVAAPPEMLLGMSINKRKQKKASSSRMRPVPSTQAAPLYGEIEAMHDHRRCSHYSLPFPLPWLWTRHCCVVVYLREYTRSKA